MEPGTRDSNPGEERPAGAAPAPPWLPSWLHRLGTAVWVSDPEQRLVFLNSHARELLGGGDELLGRPCYECVGALGADGEPACCRDCGNRRRDEAGLELLPAVWRRIGERERWLLLVPIPVRPPVEEGEEETGRAWIVHVAQELTDVERLHAYLERVAHRTSEEGSPADRLGRLTPREREVLALLAADHDPATIARRLFVSLVTVRNHVQHVLSKLGVHSAQEAVALHVLYGGGRGSGRAEPAPPAREDPN